MTGGLLAHVEDEVAASLVALLTSADIRFVI